MRDLKHILVPTDFSDGGRLALPAAVALARRSGAMLLLLHVVPPPHTSVRKIMDKRGIATLTTEICRSSHAKLAEVEAEIGDDVRTESHVVEGQPAEETARFVTEHRVDLAVLSTRGHTGLKRFMLGSTTETIVRTAPCSVLVVRRRPSPRTSAPASTEKLKNLETPFLGGRTCC